MIILETCTDEELKHLLAQCDLRMRQAGGWGPAMAKAEQDYKRVLAEIEHRRREKQRV
jgi:hypothetical protein